MFTHDPRQARIDTLIGKAARVHGDVEFLGGLHLDGRTIGAVRSDESRDSARVEGSLYYGVIEMTLCAQIIGKLLRLEPETQPAAPAPGSTA
jgi:cytoskeletal protein CcmA (bactofilin family)